MSGYPDDERFQRRNRVDITFHFVWTTFQREPVIGPDIERSVYRCIGDACTKHRCQLLAVGGMPDHVHLLVSCPASLAPADLIRDVKGITSKFISDNLLNQTGFKWHGGYGVFSVSSSHRSRVIRYIEHQKEHHTSGDLWLAAEEPSISDCEPLSSD